MELLPNEEIPEHDDLAKVRASKPPEEMSWDYYVIDHFTREREWKPYKIVSTAAVKVEIPPLP